MAESIHILKSKCTFVQGIDCWNDQWNKVLSLKSPGDFYSSFYRYRYMSIVFHNCGFHRSGKRYTIDNMTLVKWMTSR